MSGTSSTEDCPRCGAKDSLQSYADWKPFNYYGAECTECGLCITTSVSVANLKEVNERRIEDGKPPLKRLSPPSEDWPVEWEPGSGNRVTRFFRSIKQRR